MSATLSNQTIETVKATIPFLMQNGVKLTELFYKRLFEANPEVGEFFNRSNQDSGTQQRALGGAICAFAQNIETPENLAEAISKISNKHASLGIQPDHYPIVGKHLLGAIDEMLNPAPQEILDAWAEAYGFLAGVMIGAEKNLYEDQQNAEGGWNGFKKLEVFNRETESEVISSFYLKTTDGSPLPPFKPGQYLTVRVPDGEGSTTMRNYSLSGSNESDFYRISVKREDARDSATPKGYVSNYLHHNVKVGDLLEIGPPCGDFFLQEHSKDQPLLFISGGVGLTPLLSMLHSSKEHNATFIHCAINGKLHALRHEVESIVEGRDNLTTHFKYSDPSPEDILEHHYHSKGYISAEFLADYVTPETAVYFCGPKIMMISIYQALKSMNHPKELTHFEFFGPQEDLEIIEERQVL